MNTLKYIIGGVVLYTITACTATHYTVIESKGYTIPVTERLDASPDESVAEIINIYKTKVDSITSRVIGQSTIAMEVERPQSRLSNFTSDLLVETAEKNTGEKCDFGVMNIGGIRTSLPEGDITVGNIFSIFPFENSISVITLKGKDVNTLIFPNLSSANSAYKLLQAMDTDAELIGPIQMGLNKPIHFTDFESSVRDIVNITAVAVIDAIVDKKKAVK